MSLAGLCHQQVPLSTLCCPESLQRYKNNLLCASLLHDRLYLALGKRVVQVEVCTDGTIYEQKATVGVEVDSEINQLVLRSDSSREVLLAFTQEGHCHILEDMQVLSSIDNTLPSADSCWSGDIHLGHTAQEAMLVLGSNNQHLTRLFLDQDMKVTQRTSLKEHDNNIPAVSISPDGRHFVSGGIDCLICVFHRDNDRPLLRIAVDEWVWGFTWPRQAHHQYLLVGLQEHMQLYSFQETLQEDGSLDIKAEQLDSLRLPAVRKGEYSQQRRRYNIRMHAYYDLQRYNIMYCDPSQDRIFVTQQYSPFSGLVVIKEGRLWSDQILGYDYVHFAQLACAWKRVDRKRTVWYQLFEEETMIKGWLLGQPDYSLEEPLLP